MICYGKGDMILEISRWSETQALSIYLHFQVMLQGLCLHVQSMGSKLQVLKKHYLRFSGYQSDKQIICLH